MIWNEYSLMHWADWRLRGSDDRFGQEEGVIPLGSEWPNVYCRLRFQPTCPLFGSFFSIILKRSNIYESTSMTYLLSSSGYGDAEMSACVLIHF